MKKFLELIILGILIFMFSIAVGYFFSTYFYTNQNNNMSSFEANEVEEFKTQDKLNTVEAVSAEEKIIPSTELAVKEYYDECGHFNFKYIDLPNELVNLNRQEVEDFYGEEYEVEEFSKNNVILAKEINGFCENHFCIKLEDKNINVYKINPDTSFSFLKSTDIGQDYLTARDIENLQEGIYVYGEAKLNSTLEDFE